MEPFLTSRDKFHLIPSLKFCLKPYKDLARKQPGDRPLTDNQHHIANLYGYTEGWQSFQFYIKTLHEELLHIDFTDDEWGFLFDVANGWVVYIRCHDSDRLLVQVVDADRYEYLSGKWFEDQSKAWEDDEGEHYEPSKTMLVFIEKIRALNEKQQTAVIFKALTFWQATFWLPIPV